jgi:hypothetical protein
MFGAFVSMIKRKSLVIFLFHTWYCFWIHLDVTICVKLDSGMHIVMHLVFFGKQVWQGLGGLPMRSTQPERYSRSPRQRDLSVQIRGPKWPLIAKVWLPKLWASTIPSIWTCERPNSSQGARRYDPRKPCCVVSPKLEQIIFQSRALDSSRHMYFWRWYQSNLIFTLIYFDACLLSFMCVASIWP